MDSAWSSKTVDSGTQRAKDPLGTSGMNCIQLDIKCSYFRRWPRTFSFTEDFQLSDTFVPHGLIGNAIGMVASVSALRQGNRQVASLVGGTLHVCVRGVLFAVISDQRIMIRVPQNSSSHICIFDGVAACVVVLSRLVLYSSQDKRR